MTYLWRAAARQAGALADGAELARGLRAGGKLALADCSIRLNAGEVSYLETTAELWQYVGTTAPAYNRSTMIFGGGLAAMAVTAGLSAMANASRRRQEQATAELAEDIGARALARCVTLLDEGQAPTAMSKYLSTF